MAKATFILILLVLSHAKFGILCQGLFLQMVKEEQKPPLYPNVTPLSISLKVLDLYALSEQKMTFKMTYYFNLKWRDPTLMFNASHYGNSALDINLEKMVGSSWFPDIFILNLIPTDYDHLNYENGIGKLYPDGHIIFSKVVTSSLRCNMNLRKLPFDTQHCSVVFKSFNYPHEELVLKWNPVVKYHGKFAMKNITLDYFEITGKCFFIINHM